MTKIIVTNNDKVLEKYKDKFNVLFLEKGAYMDVLNETRNNIHRGCILLTHPMAGSLKPNQTPYKSIIIKESSGKLDYESLFLIEQSIEAAKKFLRFKATPNWSERILNDFKTVDISLIENVINNPMFALV